MNGVLGQSRTVTAGPAVVTAQANPQLASLASSGVVQGAIVGRAAPTDQIASTSVDATRPTRVPVPTDQTPGVQTAPAAQNGHGALILPTAAAPAALASGGDIVQGSVVGRAAGTDHTAATPADATRPTPAPVPVSADQTPSAQATNPAQAVTGVQAAAAAQNSQGASVLPADVAAAPVVLSSLSAAEPKRSGATSIPASAQTPTQASGATTAAPDADGQDGTQTPGAAPARTLASSLSDGATTGPTTPHAATTDPASAPLTPTPTAAHLAAAAAPDTSIHPANPSVADDAVASAAVTSDTISSLASQTASQAPSQLGGGASQFQIELHPFGLGRVDVSVQIDSAGQLSAAFAFDKPQTAEALGARSGELQKALEQAGFSLADAGLSFSVTHAAASSAATSMAQAQADGSASRPHLATSTGQPAQGFNSGGQSFGHGFGQGARQDTPANAGQASGRGRAFAAATETAVAADQPPTPAYASRATAGVDIRI